MNENELDFTEFRAWLRVQLEVRGWSYRKLAQRGGFSEAMVSHVMRGFRAVTFPFCQGVAQALGLPPEDVLRHAGLLEPVTEIERAQELVATLARAPQGRVYLVGLEVLLRAVTRHAYDPATELLTWPPEANA